jgi:hypothetical protein
MLWAKPAVAPSAKFHAWREDDDGDPTAPVCGHAMDRPSRNRRQDKPAENACTNCVRRLASSELLEAKRSKPLGLWKAEHSDLRPCPICDLAGVHGRLCPSYTTRQTIQAAFTPNLHRTVVRPTAVLA